MNLKLILGEVMKAEIKRRWLNALRSGRYVQTKSRLRRTDPDTFGRSYCCLGVLCDIQLSDARRESWFQENSRKAAPSYEFSADLSDDEIGTLMHLNDSLEQNFDQIANWIEENIPIMDPDIKKQWLDALRSGDYKQTRGILETQTYDPEHDYREGQRAYCCLGVLCQIQGLSPLDSLTHDESVQVSLFPPQYKAGLGEKELQYLAGMNDRGENFESIANHIERYY